MTRRAFRHAISELILLAVSSPLWAASVSAPCHDNYSAASFEEAGESLAEFIDEYFVSAHLPFLPARPDMAALKLPPAGPGIYRAPDALHTGGGHRLYPTRPGLWKVVNLGGGIWEYHLLIREPQILSETQAFNTYNDLLGEAFADYDDQAYAMTLQPEDVRRQYRDRYFTLNVTVYGLRDDATQLPRTFADVILTDYTAWVRQNTRCRHAAHATTSNPSAPGGKR